MGDASDRRDAAVQRHWRKRADLSSFAAGANEILDLAGFDRGPWLVVAFAAGIGAWFMLDSPWQWMAAAGLAGILGLAAASLWRDREDRANIRLAALSISLTFALGVTVVWARSGMVGAEPIERPRVERIEARILEREEQPALDRIRLTVTMRDAVDGVARKVRINLPRTQDKPSLIEGSIIRVRVRLMPPAPPMLPDGYDFARSAWFEGLSATGSVIGSVEIVKAEQGGGPIPQIQRALSSHVSGQLEGSAAGIAAALVSGDRGSISSADEQAMRDAGLTHLLSISGLHVSAVIAAAYFLALRLLALWPWFALRVRLPLVAAGMAALSGVAYTLLTGSEVPTIRSCVGAVLVLLALALGREPLSMRLVAVAAGFVLCAWPESLVGPSFQMSFTAVLAIVALHAASPVREFLAPREEGWIARIARRLVVLLMSGLVIELALMPIVLFHFHRAGLYGAFANVVAIPLVTFAIMPLEAIALLLDLVGLGAPAWWLVQHCIDFLLAIARFTAAQPGAVKLAPQIGALPIILFTAGGLWLALWTGKARRWGVFPACLAVLMMVRAQPPDILISSDGRHVGITGEGDRLLVLREGRSDYSRDNLLEMAAMDGEPATLEQWSGARCSTDFCAITIARGGRDWSLLMSRSRSRIEERALAAACTRADIVVADRWLPQSCQPRWLKADRRYLERNGGLAIHLADRRIDTVAQGQGQHGWWRGGRDQAPFTRKSVIAPQ